jgi:hypothetical protein
MTVAENLLLRTTGLRGCGRLAAMLLKSFSHSISLQGALRPLAIFMSIMIGSE